MRDDETDEFRRLGFKLCLGGGEWTSLLPGSNLAATAPGIPAAATAAVRDATGVLASEAAASVPEVVKCSVPATHNQGRAHRSHTRICFAARCYEASLKCTRTKKRVTLYRWWVMRGFGKQTSEGDVSKRDGCE